MDKNSFHGPGGDKSQAVGKPIILLIPNNSWWILGKMAREIEIALSDRYQFIRISEIVFEWRPQLLQSTLECVHAVHCLNESSAALLKKIDAAFRPPVNTWIHHVTTWNDEHQAACEVSTSLTACTDGWNAYLSERCPSKPVHTVRHGVDSTVFRPMVGARQQYGFCDSDFVVGFFGSKGSDSDNNRKGIDVFVASLKRAATQIPHLKVVIVGPGWSEVVEGLKSEGLAIRYLGKVPDSQLPSIYSAIDAYMVTARVEGGPCTVLESMACGTPVIATRVGLVPEVVEDWNNGVSVPIDDVNTMTEALVGLSKLSANERLRLSENARATAAERPWEKMLRPLGEVYEDLLGRCTRGVKKPRHAPGRISNLAMTMERLFSIRAEAPGLRAMRYLSLLTHSDPVDTIAALDLLRNSKKGL